MDASRYQDRDRSCLRRGGGENHLGTRREMASPMARQKGRRTSRDWRGLSLITRGLQFSSAPVLAERAPVWPVERKAVIGLASDAEATFVHIRVVMRT